MLGGYYTGAAADFTVQPGGTLEAFIEGFPPGLVAPQLGYSVMRDDDTPLWPRSDTGLSEDAPGSGRYKVMRFVPADTPSGTYILTLDAGGGVLAPGNFRSVVIGVGYVAPPPPVTVPVSPGCGIWIGGDDIATAPCAPDTTDVAIFDNAAAIASTLLYQWSGGRYAGRCVRTVRPVAARCQHWAGSIWTWVPTGYPVYLGGGFLGLYGGFGCPQQSQIDLYGHVRRVVEVLIDGAVVDPSLYAVQSARYLVRTDGSGWSGCQDINRPLSEVGTFAVTYEWGIDPPPAGVAAAVQLGCELAKLLSGDDTCELPAGVTSVIRQGTSWTLAQGAQRTLLPAARGLDLVNVFLSSVPRRGLQPPIIANPQAIQQRRV